ncbi:hypothetical protein D3C87_1604430 [compost metagenome]
MDKTRAELTAQYGVRTEKVINGERYFFYDMDTTIVDTIAEIHKLQWWVTWRLRERYDKWFDRENQRGTRFFMELDLAAIDWDRFPSYYSRGNGVVMCWYDQLSSLRSVHEGLSMWFGRGLATYIHGNTPVIPWEAIRCCGAIRKNGSVSRFFVQDQIQHTELVSTINDVCRLLKLAGPNFNPEEDLNSPQEDK